MCEFLEWFRLCFVDWKAPLSRFKDQLAKIWACVDKNEACPGPVDCSSIKVVAKDYKGMLFGGGFGGGGFHVDSVIQSMP